tara:strand:+ start:39605 stop:40195 length:591 start_codon:yes stop_codon:yes gene_type:complete
MGKNPEIRVERVRSTANKQVVQLELRKEQASSADGSLLNMSLGSRAKKYVDWFPVDINFLEAYGYDFDPVELGDIVNAPKQEMTLDGDNLFNNHLTRVSDVEISTRPGESFPEEFPVVDLFITESFEPSYDGHKPKQNPSTNEVMCKEGKPIYWQCETKIAEHEESFDTFIQADGTKEAGVTADPLVQMMSNELPA